MKRLRLGGLWLLLISLAVVGIVVLTGFVLTRQAGDGDGGTGGGISVATAIGADRGAGGAGGLGPAQIDGEGSPVGADSGAPSPAPPSEGGSVLRIPNLRLAFSAMIAQAGANPSFTYRAGVEARDGAQYDLAVALFDRVVDAGGPLAPFAEFRAAQMVSLLDTPDAVEDAANRYTTLLAEGGPADRLPDSVRLIAITEGANALEVAERDAEALALLERIEDAGAGSFTLADSLWQRAGILESSGMPGWQELAVRAMETQPGSNGAIAALDLLDEYGEPYPRLVAAYVAYRAFRNEDALARYEALLDEGALDDVESGEAWFYIGALRERAFDGEGAIEAYGSSLAADPDGDWADDARYWRGRVLEQLARPEEAVTEYDLLVADFPDSDFAEESELRAAIALGLSDSGAESTSRLADLTRTASPETAAEAAHWHDVLVALFEAPPAELAPATAYDPTSYAAAFEASGDAIAGPLPADATEEQPGPINEARAPIDVWIASALGASRGAEAPILEDADVKLAWVLVEAGEPGVARGLLTSEVFARTDEPYELVSLAFEAKRQGLYDIAMTIGGVLLDEVEPAERLDAPRELLALAYPLPYLDDATEAAAEFDVPVLLLYALMRQESAFNPEAGSSAGAFGLTQVISDTGAAIADALGMPAWTFADLARPSVATRFGAYYLSEQLDAFDGHMLAALSAYNGGPGNAARWLEAQPFEGPDGFLYAVDFTETRTYLEHVSANYAMYRYIYGHAETPRLPHGE